MTTNKWERLIDEMDSALARLAEGAETIICQAPNCRNIIPLFLGDERFCSFDCWLESFEHGVPLRRGYDTRKW